MNTHNPTTAERLDAYRRARAAHDAGQQIDPADLAQCQGWHVVRLSVGPALMFEGIYPTRQEAEAADSRWWREREAAEIAEKDARIAELEEALESQVERSNWNNLTEAEKSRVLGMKP